MSYAAEIDGASAVLRVIVGTPAWATANLGGVWVDTVRGDPVEQYAGPEMVETDKTALKFVREWRPWAGDNDLLYQVDDWAAHNGEVYVSTIPNNAYEPGVYGWNLLPGVVGAWSAGLAPYDLDERCHHPNASTFWISRRPVNVWVPGDLDSGWMRYGEDGPYPYYYLGPQGYPVDWLVTDAGRIWQSSANGIWRQPGVVPGEWIDMGPIP